MPNLKVGYVALSNFAQMQFQLLKKAWFYKMSECQILYIIEKGFTDLGCDL